MKAFNVSRGAIIIGCPGTSNNFLPGVNPDINNVKKFLQSDKGGSWNTDEIILLDNPSEQRVNQVIANTKKDYLLIYFSGHGYTDLRKRRMISLKDNSIPDTNLLNDSPRQLVIIDACRNFVSSGIGGLDIQAEGSDNFESFSTYDFFSEQIMLSPYGKIIVHSTQSGYSSYDTRDGGVFTTNLLKVSTRMISEFEYQPCNIQTLLKFVPQFISSSGFKQSPMIAYTTGNLSVPFALTISEFEKQQRALPNNSKPESINSNFENFVNAALLTLALVCVVGAIASGSKS